MKKSIVTIDLFMKLFYLFSIFYLLFGRHLAIASVPFHKSGGHVIILTSKLMFYNKNLVSQTRAL